MFRDIVTVQFIGGSKDGAKRNLKGAPEYLEVNLPDGRVEIYERQSEEPPFVYVQVGYADKEQWK